MSIKVSVIIPVYNSEKYIKKCLESILSQTYKNYEIIVVNDGSTDNTKMILEEYANNYSDKIIHIEQANKGVAKTRNEAMQIAKGEYIAFIDNDDYIEEDYLEKFVKEAEKGKYDVVIGGYQRPNEKGKIVKRLELKEEEWSKMMILAPWAKIYKREYLIDNKIIFLSNNIGEDIYFNLQALMLSERVKIINYVGYNWFFNTKSVSNTTQKNIKNLDVYKLLNSCYDVVKEKNILKNSETIIELHFIRYIIWLLSYASKGLTYKEIGEEYNKLFNWLQKRFPNYKKNKLIGIGKPKGEIVGIQFLYLGFMIFHKLRLGKIVVWIYSKL